MAIENKSNQKLLMRISNSLFLTIGPGDFLVHHAIAPSLHTTTLILVKGALDARSSTTLAKVILGKLLSTTQQY